MTTVLRLTATEQEEIRKKAVEINKILIARGLQPLRDSQLLHEVIAKAIRHVKIGESGDLIIDPP